MTNKIYCETPFQTFCNKAHESELDSPKCKKFLIDVRDILKSADIQYFLLFGTLLGAYRDNDFIKHDKDIDIGIFAESEKKIEELISSGTFAEKGIETFKERNYSFCRDETYLDIYPFALDGDDFRSRLGWAYNYRLNKKYFPLQNISFMDENFSTISNIEDYLTEKYGTNWNEKIKNKFASS
jgi:phosphorylcholine metabolism protein LicD